MTDYDPESEEHRRQLIELVESLPDYVSIADADGRILYLNGALRRFCGLPESLSGELGFDVPEGLAEPRSAGNWLAPDWAAERIAREGFPTAEEQGVWQGETALLDSEGREIPMHQTIIAHRDGGGRVTRYSTIMRDISDRKAVMAALEDSNRSLEQFAYAVSHDLQEPLRMVAGYLGLIERRYTDALDAEGLEFLAYAVDGAKRMHHMIGDLLSYSRVNTQGSAPRPVEPAEAARLAIGNLEALVADTGAEVHVEEPLPLVQADAGQLVSAFQNLIGNALKYRYPDRPPRITVSGGNAPWSGWVCLTVADNGLGIAKADQDRIFGIFQRLDTKSEGSGIGLALVKRIVERVGGRVWVDSEPGEGSAFHLMLPGVEG